MQESNIVAGSNVYLSRTESPFWDPDFVAQVQDYKLLKYISSKRQTDNRVAAFSGNQGEILRTEMRCIYAPKDPCWGYVKERKRVLSACINGECPKIYECNPKYTAEDAAYWVTTDEERKQYGNPDKQPRYYIVDMISDEEMTRYDSNPKNEGYEYPVPKNPVLKDKRDTIESEPKTKIDPRTGRRMVVVGYKWMITDTSDYQNEELIPIWGFVEEVEERKQPTVRKKAKRIEKKQIVEQPKRKPVLEEKTPDPDYARKDDFEKAVASHISGEIKLTDVDEDSISAGTVILLDNLAELAFVSSTLLVSEIKHGIKAESGIMLSLIDDYEKFADRPNVMISNTVLKSGCKESNVGSWKALSQKEEIERLNISDRDYYQYKYDNGSRWTCRNMYGVTHVCVSTDDVKDIDNLSDGIYSVSLVDDGDTYMILDKSGTPMGHLGGSFVEVINSLKKDEEISGTPAVIKGISLSIAGGKLDILGMGHLKFIEY